MDVYRFYIIGAGGQLIRSVRFDCPRRQRGDQQAELMLDGHSVADSAT